MRQGHSELALTGLVYNADIDFTPARPQTIILINADLPLVSIT